VSDDPRIGRLGFAAVHRAALHLYPQRFRDLFGDELHRVFDERVNGEAGRSGPKRAALALFLIADAACSGLLERARHRHERWAWPRHGAPSRHRSLTMSLETIRRDLALALRQFGRAPMFAVLTVASLALGIGANTAMFAIVHGVLLQPLPYGAPGELVTIWSHNSKNNEPNNPVSPANFEAFRAAPSLAQVEGMYSFLTPVQVRIGSEPEATLASQVTPGMLSLLGRAPIIGRTFDAGGAPDGAVLSYAFWQRRFGGDPNVVGQTLTLTGAGEAAAIPILGVMPADFTFPYGSMLASTGFTTKLDVDMWFPMSRQRDRRLVDATGQPNRTIHYFGVIGRLRPGATVDTARAELEGIARQRAVDFADTNAGWGVTVRSLHEQTVGQLRAALLILLGGVGVVLLITCINVANVLLAKAAGRGRDLAIRSALGASRARLIQQTLTETVLLSVVGGLVGLGVMFLAIRATVAAAPSSLPRIGEVAPGIPVLVFALALSLIAGIAVGIIPALTAARSRAGDSLRDGTRTTASRSRRRTRAALIVAEVALAMALAVGGGLLLRSFVRVLNVDPGFNPDNLLTMQVAVPSRVAGQNPAAILAFYDELEGKLRALPGVKALGGTTRLPLGSTNVSSYIEIEGRPMQRAELPEVEMRRAMFDYFDTMEIPVVRGRTFTRDDHAQSPDVTVINDVLAARLFPGEDAVGKRVRFATPANQDWMSIIGVVGSIRHGSLEEVPRPEIYITYRQGPPVGPFLVLRTSSEPAQLSAAVRQVVRDMGADPPRDVRTMDAIRSGSVAQRRFMLVLVGVFGVIALGLAAMGVFGVVTLIAAERTAEVGIRLALGATPSQVLQMVLSQAVRLTGVGIAIGAVVSLVVAPVLRSQLFGITVFDPITYAGVALVLVLTALAGAVVPARRAMSVDPVTALRT
jgi:putative ABC transport system permease protein